MVRGHSVAAVFVQSALKAKIVLRGCHVHQIDGHGIGSYGDGGGLRESAETSRDWGGPGS